MSTVSSISPALDQLADLARQDAGLARDPAFPESSLFARLSQVPDRRKRRGRRHEPVVVLVLAACATLVVGNDSVSAIWQWSAGTSQEVLARIGARRDPLRGQYLVPSERTFRRVLAGLDSDALDLDRPGVELDAVSSEDFKEPVLDDDRKPEGHQERRQEIVAVSVSAAFGNAAGRPVAPMWKLRS